jgi:hypothetical protein
MTFSFSSSSSSHHEYKDRKQIVKVLKPHVERMCINDEAQLVLFSALDVIECVSLVILHLSRSAELRSYK